MAAISCYRRHTRPDACFSPSAEKPGDEIDASDGSPLRGAKPRSARRSYRCPSPLPSPGDTILRCVPREIRRISAKVRREELSARASGAETISAALRIAFSQRRARLSTLAVSARRPFCVSWVARRRHAASGGSRRAGVRSTDWSVLLLPAIDICETCLQVKWALSVMYVLFSLFVKSEASRRQSRRIRVAGRWYLLAAHTREADARRLRAPVTRERKSGWSARAERRRRSGPGIRRMINAFSSTPMPDLRSSSVDAGFRFVNYPESIRDFSRSITGPAAIRDGAGRYRHGGARRTRDENGRKMLRGDGRT